MAIRDRGRYGRLLFKLLVKATYDGADPAGVEDIVYNIIEPGKTYLIQVAGPVYSITLLVNVNTKYISDIDARLISVKYNIADSNNNWSDKFTDDLIWCSDIIAIEEMETFEQINNFLSEEEGKDNLIDESLIRNVYYRESATAEDWEKSYIAYFDQE